jgi:phage gp29-like protein
MKVSMKKMQEAVGLPAPEGDEEVLMTPAAAGAGAAPETGEEEGENTLADKAAAKPPGAQDGADTAETASTRVLGRLRGLKSGADIAAAAANRNVPVVETDDVDLIGDALLSDWEEMLSPMITGFAEKIAAAGSIEAARGLLIDGLEEMDDAALVALLEGAGVSARLAGELDVQSEQADG